MKLISRVRENFREKSWFVCTVCTHQSVCTVCSVCSACPACQLFSSQGLHTKAPFYGKSKRHLSFFSCHASSVFWAIFHPSDYMAPELLNRLPLPHALW